MAYIVLDGTRIYYEESGQGQTLLMIHGATQDTLSWLETLTAFSKTHHVLSIDLPGHGKSALRNQRPTRDSAEHAEIIGRFIVAKGLRDTILVGHSMGAGIAIMTSIACPDVIKGVVAVDGGAAFRGPVGVHYSSDILRNVEINVTDWLETMFHSVLGRTTSEARRKEMAFDSTRCSPYVQYSDLLTYTSLNLNEHLHRITKPVFYIMGEDDWSTTPQMAQDTSARLKAMGIPTDCVVLEGIGHIPHWEQPDAFNAALRQVLANF
jgi:pimeloyl-ACP methyl ester carboxylesterase